MLITVGKHEVTVEEIKALLNQPLTVSAGLLGLEKLLISGTLHELNAVRLRLMLAAIRTAQDPVATLKQLKAQSELNLLQALTPAHFGRALETGLIPWATMLTWTQVATASKVDKAVEERSQASTQASS